MTEKRPLPGFKDGAPPDRYCDLVLTGGVTSAIAYPGVIFGLGQVYRFNSIGGSSSGAGSAALAAAAEYRRRHGSSEGFRVMLQRTAQVADCTGGKTGLEWLFQPEPGTRRLFRMLVKGFAGPSNRCRLFIRGFVQAYIAPLYWAVLGCVVLPPYVVWQIGGSCGLILVAALAGILAALVLVVRQAVRALGADLTAAIDADFGLCSGMPPDGSAAHPPITPWLHELIQDIAGLPLDRPLTFEDLARAPGGPRETLGDSSPAGLVSIDLRMYAANVTTGRPQLLPLPENDEDVFFLRAEMLRLFPASVVDAMCRDAKPIVERLAQTLGVDNARAMVAALRVQAPMRGGKGSQQPPPPEAQAFLWLPSKRMPVVVAARMSVSFPVLFSAVPLWRLNPARREMQRMLLVDGGLCANFPIHLFDSPVPAWPTFGVALHDLKRSTTIDPERAHRFACVPASVEAPAPRRLATFDQQQKPSERVLGFAEAAFGTIKDWNDALQSELPGVRERLAHLWLPDNIGGLNILMDSTQIEWLARAGGAAARKLLDRYAVPGDGTPQGTGWQEHRWVRLNVLAASLRGFTPGVARSVQGGRYSVPLREQIRAATERPPFAGASVLQPAQAAQLEQVLDALLALERHLGPDALDLPDPLHPTPALRVRPPL